MGFGGISIWSLLLILVIVLLLFGTKKLRNIGTDLGGAIKGFKSAMHEGEKGQDKESPQLEGEQKEESRSAAEDAGSTPREHQNTRSS